MNCLAYCNFEKKAIILYGVLLYTNLLRVSILITNLLAFNKNTPLVSLTGKVVTYNWLESKLIIGQFIDKIEFFANVY
jgi:hypothetical protein